MRRAPTGITLVTTHKRNYRKNRSRAELKSQSPSPPLKSHAAPGHRPETEWLLIMDDITKLLSGVMSRLALQGDGPLREPSPCKQGIFCAVVNH